MKKYAIFSRGGCAIALGLCCFVSLTSCAPAVDTPSSIESESVEKSDISSSADSEAPPSTTSESGPVVEVNAYSTDELFDAGSGGCGMSLLASDTNFGTDNFIFFHEFEGPALMKLDDELTQLTRTAASGEEFYGQHTSQSFETEDGAIAVDVNVTIGEPGEIESVSIPEGTLTVTAEGQSEEIAVTGDAGC